MLTVELVRRGAARHARRTTVRCGGQSLTYAEVDAAANRIANVPAGLGVARGARVGLLVGNGIWLIALDFGCLKASTARVPLNTRLAADEQARMLAATGVRLLVHDADQAGRTGELAAQLYRLRLASLGPAPEADALDLPAAMGQASDADPRTPSDAADPVLGSTPRVPPARSRQSSTPRRASHGRPGAPARRWPVPPGNPRSLAAPPRGYGGEAELRSASALTMTRPR